jgi:hypothetical protein
MGIGSENFPDFSRPPMPAIAHIRLRLTMRASRRPKEPSMGVFTQAVRRPYAPPIDTLDASRNSSNQTFLGTGDPSLIRVSDSPPMPDDDVQLAQQRPTAPLPQRRQPPRPTPQPEAPAPSPAEMMAQPGRGYGDLPHSIVERDLSADEKRANRSAALLELARQPLTPDATRDPLPDDWQRTKRPEVVDEITRAAQRHGVPVQILARLLYQEGKFGAHPTKSSSTNPDDPIGPAQITSAKFGILKTLARDRGDLPRARELASYSLANREQAFDTAAELLAYQRRLLGSWHAAVGGYNVGENFFMDWLAGRDRSESYERNGKLVTYSRDPIDLPKNKEQPELSKWPEFKKYLRIIFRGAPDEAPAYKIYDYHDPERIFRVPPYIPRSPNMPISVQIPRDAKENP